MTDAMGTEPAMAAALVLTGMLVTILGLMTFVRLDRHSDVGGLHDRLDVLMGMRCRDCNKHIGNGALRLHRAQRCRCRENDKITRTGDSAGRTEERRPTSRRRKRQRRRGQTGQHTGRREQRHDAARAGTNV